MFRDDLLSGRRIAFAGGGGVAILAQLRALGAWVGSVGDLGLPDEAQASTWVADRLPLHGLVFDARPGFAAGGEPGLRTSLQAAWVATRAVATGALIPGGGGKLLLLAPASRAGAHVEATRAGLENLARTLSVEWARFGVTAVAVCPGPATTDAELAELTAFLLSPAGEYLSGCRFDLGAVPAPRSSGLIRRS